jgi:hypothetical protein
MNGMSKTLYWLEMISYRLAQLAAGLSAMLCVMFMATMLISRIDENLGLCALVAGAVSMLSISVSFRIGKRRIQEIEFEVYGTRGKQ